MKNRFALMAMTAVVACGMILTGCGNKQADNNASTDKKTEQSTANNNTSTDKKADTSTPAASGDAQVINVTAKNWGWELDKTEVKKGKPVTLKVTGQEGMHGLTIDGTTIDNVHVMAGQSQDLTFTPDKAGDLTIHCTLMCGTGHATMKATLKVVD